MSEEPPKNTEDETPELSPLPPIRPSSEREAARREAEQFAAMVIANLNSEAHWKKVERLKREMEGTK